jgi:hypothetical protein
LTAVLALSSLATVSAQAEPTHTDLAKKVFKIDEETKLPVLIAQFFNEAAKVKGSPLNKVMAKVRAEAKKDGSFIDEDAAQAEDIVRLDSGQSGGTYSARYLLIIKAGYKSSVFPVAYFEIWDSARDGDEENTTIAIDHQATVEIN